MHRGPPGSGVRVMAFAGAGVSRTPIIAAVVLVIAAGTLAAQPNPFYSPGPAESSGERSARGTEPTGPGVFPALTRRLVEQQRVLNARLSGFLRRAEEAESGPFGVVSIVVVAFFYGVLHSFLPGHRKSVIVSYYISQSAPWRHGVFAGFLFAGLHAVSAVLIFIGIYLSTGASFGASLGSVTRTLQIVSSVLILAVGSVFVVAKVRTLIRARRDAARKRLNETFGMTRREQLRGHLPAVSQSKFFAIVLSTGMVPCPGSTMLLLFALSLGLVQTGLISIIAMSLGLGVALSAIAILTIVLKERIVRWTGNALGGVVVHAIELAGATFIVMFGIVTLTAVV